MKHSVAFKFNISAKTPESSKGLEEAKVYTAIASTAALDRDREVLIPKGAMIEEFMKNPVMLHIHNYSHVPVGKVISVDVKKDEVTFDFNFAPTELGKQLEDLYSKGFMNAFSVGFYPHKYYWIGEETADQIKVDLPDGKSENFDISSYKIRPRGVISQWELLEISPVPVPSNPEALLQRSANYVVRKCFGDTDSAASQILKSQLDLKTKELHKLLKDFNDSVETIQIQNAIPVHSTEVDMEKSWDSLSTDLVCWACEDGSGDKEKMDWGKYSQGFAFVDSEKADQFSSYKYPHHTVKDDNLVAVWKGVTLAMSEILSSQNSEEAKSVYDHLAFHYKDAGVEPPPFGVDYSEEELKSISENTWKLKSEDSSEVLTDTDTSTVDSENFDEKSLEQLIKDTAKAIQDSITEVNETNRIRMNLLINHVKELQIQLKSIRLDNVDQVPDPDKDEKKFGSQFEELNNLLKTINK